MRDATMIEAASKLGKVSTKKYLLEGDIQEVLDTLVVLGLSVLAVSRKNGVGKEHLSEVAGGGKRQMKVEEFDDHVLKVQEIGMRDLILEEDVEL